MTPGSCCSSTMEPNPRRYRSLLSLRCWWRKSLSFLASSHKPQPGGTFPSRRDTIARRFSRCTLNKTDHHRDRQPSDGRLRTLVRRRCRLGVAHNGRPDEAQRLSPLVEDCVWISGHEQGEQETNGGVKKTGSKTGMKGLPPGSLLPMEWNPGEANKGRRRPEARAL